MDNSELFEEMLQIDDEWGEVPQASLLEDIAEDLEEETEILQYELLTKKEAERQFLYQLAFGVAGIVLPVIINALISLFTAVKPLNTTTFIFGGFLVIYAGIQRIRSKVYWNPQMPMSYQAKSNRTDAEGAPFILVGIAEIVFAVMMGNL